MSIRKGRRSVACQNSIKQFRHLRAFGIIRQQTFKASEIGREFGFRSLAKNFSSSLEENHPQQVQQDYNYDTSNQQSHSGASFGIASLLGDLLTPNGHSPEENNTLKTKKKKTKKRYYGRQF